MSYKSWPPRLMEQTEQTTGSCTLDRSNISSISATFHLSQPLIYVPSCTFDDEYYSRYCDILRSIRRHCPSCCFMERIFGQMSPPLMDGWTSEMSCETVQSWENTFFQVARWSTWPRKRPSERDHELHNKLPIDLSHITSYHWQIIKWHYKLQSTTNFFQQVLESIIGGRIVQVIHQSLDGRSVWLGTTQLLNCQANVLVGAGATADMAGSAGRDKQTLAANHLLLGQGGGLALLVHLKFEMASRN